MARTASPDGAQVFFMNPSDGETDSNPMTMVSGIEGMTVVPAGNDTAQSGHHHLLFDTDLADSGLSILKDDNHVHTVDGSTETEITLQPGGPHTPVNARRSPAYPPRSARVVGTNYDMGRIKY